MEYHQTLKFKTEVERLKKITEVETKNDQSSQITVVL